MLTSIEPQDAVPAATLLATSAAVHTIPCARMLLADADDLRADATGYLRACHTWHIWRLQRGRGLPLLPPCTWCGLPTGNWCDHCEAHGGPLRPLCAACEKDAAPRLGSCVFCQRSMGVPEATKHSLIGMTHYHSPTRRRHRHSRAA